MQKSNYVYIELSEKYLYPDSAQSYFSKEIGNDWKNDLTNARSVISDVLFCLFVKLPVRTDDQLFFARDLSVTSIFPKKIS